MIKILIVITVFFFVYIASIQILTIFFSLTPIPKESATFITDLFSGIIIVLVYILLFQFYEKRNVHEFSPKTMGINLFLGTLWGSLLQISTILVIYFWGEYKIVSVNRINAVIPAFSFALTAALFEETLFRGVLFRLLEEKIGTYIALFVSAFIFGMMHLLNPGSSFGIALLLSIQSGLLLGAAYIYARSLWFPIAIHFGWNFIQSGVFGAIVSGNVIEKSLFTSKITGSIWITGGEFGPEGSIQATFFCLCTTTLLLFLSHRKKRIVTFGRVFNKKKRGRTHKKSYSSQAKPL